MLRRTLAVFLILSWVALSGIDIVEDLDLPFKVEFERSGEIPGPGAKRGGFAHNITEFANASRIVPGAFFNFSGVRSVGDPSKAFSKSAKLHKYHQRLLI